MTITTIGSQVAHKYYAVTTGVVTYVGHILSGGKLTPVVDVDWGDADAPLRLRDEAGSARRGYSPADLRAKYLIAFGKRPQPGFLETLVQIAANDGVNILGARLAPGPGCWNLGLLMAPNEDFVTTLTLVLQPAKWCTTTDSIAEGQFTFETEAV